jgi:hypothetical protein
MFGAATSSAVRPLRLARPGLLALPVLLVLAATVLAADARVRVDVLCPGGGTWLYDDTQDEAFGWSVAGAGDMNGDGFADFIVGRPWADASPGGDPAPNGIVSVYFGTGQPMIGEADTFFATSGGLYVGGVADALAGWSVANAGDTNGDGIPDVVVGAVGNSTVYVVFGRSTSGSIDLSALAIGPKGFQAFGGSGLGMSVASAGDVNEDGLDDILVGGGSMAYVIWGRDEYTAVDVDTITIADGYRISAPGASLALRAGFDRYVANAGDLNADGKPDALIGTPSASPGGRTTAGGAFLVFGQTALAEIDAATMDTTAGFRLDGAVAGDATGHSVAGLGDVNGDGRPDLALGAPAADPGVPPRANAGRAYVVYGPAASGNVDLASLGTGGYRINGAAGQTADGPGDYAGLAVAQAGDVNLDGRPDLLVGSAFAESPNCAFPLAGSDYVVYGQTTASVIELSALPANAGYQVSAPDGSYQAGTTGSEYIQFAVSSGGDLDEDGRPDVLVGAPFSDFDGAGQTEDVGGLWGERAPFPRATTNAATGVTQTAATLNGEVADYHDYVETAGGPTPVTYRFQYGLTTAYGSQTAATNVPAGDPASVSAAISGLKADTTYHFRLRATNALGTTYGNDMTFTTTRPSLTISNRTVTEPDTGTVNAGFTVRLSAASSRTVTVRYTTAAGTATSADYVYVTNVVTFTPGQVAKTVNVAVKGDLLDEPNETFKVNLTFPVRATIADGQGIGTIADNDPAPTLRINNRSVTETDSGSVLATFSISLSAKSGKTVTVKYGTANGTAVAPGDYTAKPPTLVTFLPGQLTKMVSITVRGDLVNEANETFTVNLTAPVNATIADAQGIGTIIDDAGG